MLPRRWRPLQVRPERECGAAFQFEEDDGAAFVFGADDAFCLKAQAVAVEFQRPFEVCYGQRDEGDAGVHSYSGISTRSPAK